MFVTVKTCLIFSKKTRKHAVSCDVEKIYALKQHRSIVPGLRVY